jgi:flavin-binding protein dodecin
MSDRVYKLSEIVGTSTESIEKAIQAALERASDSIRNLRWFEVVTTRGYIHPEHGLYYQVTLKVGFQLED